MGSVKIKYGGTLAPDRTVDELNTYLLKTYVHDFEITLINRLLSSRIPLDIVPYADKQDYEGKTARELITNLAELHNISVTDPLTDVIVKLNTTPLRQIGVALIPADTYLKRLMRDAPLNFLFVGSGNRLTELYDSTIIGRKSMIAMCCVRSCDVLSVVTGYEYLTELHTRLDAILHDVNDRFFGGKMNITSPE